MPNVLKSGSLNFLESSESVQSCNGIAFLPPMARNLGNWLCISAKHIFSLSVSSISDYFLKITGLRNTGPSILVPRQQSFGRTWYLQFPNHLIREGISSETKFGNLSAKLHGVIRDKSLILIWSSVRNPKIPLGFFFVIILFINKTLRRTVQFVSYSLQHHSLFLSPVFFILLPFHLQCISDEWEKEYLQNTTSIS